MVASLQEACASVGRLSAIALLHNLVLTTFVHGVKAPIA
jgi:hypothetical protein